MKLSDIKGEQALDVIAEIIDPLSEIAMDKDLVREFRSGKPKLLLVKRVIKEHKSSIIKILASLELKTVDEYLETANLITMPNQLLEILNDPQMATLFFSQSQTEETSSGSASGTTEAVEE